MTARRPTPQGPQVATTAVRPRGRTTAELIEANRGPGLAVTTGRVLLGLLAVLAVLTLLFLVASAIEGNDPGPRAPWSAPSAPDVAPPPLSAQ